MWPFASEARAELIPIDPEAAELLNKFRQAYPDLSRTAHTAPKQIAVSASDIGDIYSRFTGGYGVTTQRAGRADNYPPWQPLDKAFGPNSALIGLRQNMPEENALGTLAHELGHVLLPDSSEAEADLFRVQPFGDTATLRAETARRDAEGINSQVFNYGRTPYGVQEDFYPLIAGLANATKANPNQTVEWETPNLWYAQGPLKELRSELLAVLQRLYRERIDAAAKR